MDTLGRTFGPSSPQGVANLLTLSGALAPRLTIGPYAGQRLLHGGGTGLASGLLTAGELVREGAAHDQQQQGLQTMFDILSGKQPMTQEAMANIPPEWAGPMLSRVAQQAEDRRFTAGLDQFIRDRASRAVSPIQPGAAPSSIAPSTQDTTEAREAFTAPPSPPPLTLDDLARLASLGPRGQKFAETIETSGYREEQNQLRREMQKIYQDARAASTNAKLYEIDKRYDGLQASIAGLMERVKEQEAGKTSRQESADAAKSARQLEKLQADMQKLQALITAKHEDVATQTGAKHQDVATHEAGVTARQNARQGAPSRSSRPSVPPKLTEGDKKVEAFIPKFRLLTTSPDRDEQAQRIINTESQINPSMRPYLIEAYQRVQRESTWIEMGKQWAQRQATPPKTAAEIEAATMLKKLGY